MPPQKGGVSVYVEWAWLEGAWGRVVPGCGDSGSVSLILQMQWVGCIRKQSLKDCAADTAGFFFWKHRLIGCHVGQSRRRQRRVRDSTQIHPLQNPVVQETSACSLILQPLNSSVQVVGVLLARHIHYTWELHKQGPSRKVSENPSPC